jgi:hypothetical protein
MEAIRLQKAVEKDGKIAVISKTVQPTRANFVKKHKFRRCFL